jgi:hypothetical protein
MERKIASVSGAWWWKRYRINNRYNQLVDAITEAVREYAL